jgi:phosphate/sulfate permease
MEQVIAYVGFMIAAYSVIANDVIQTLGTFLSSNHKKSWQILWAFAGTILAVTMIYGWYTFDGDVSYARLANIPLPEKIQWWYLLAPLTLLIITRFGIPVSTTFMILSVFSTQTLIEKMIVKSVFGYALAVISALLIYLVIAKRFESKSSLEEMDKKKQKKFWMGAQWCSTAFLWSQWLIQDFANIYVFLPRQLGIYELLGSLLVILAIMAYIFKNRGGKIQEIVNQKANTQNIRSATLIDICYALLLYIYGNMNSVPMSTTWTFIGILAGREIAINYLLQKDKLKKAYHLIVKDFAKVNIGLAISIAIAYLIQLLK